MPHLWERDFYMGNNQLLAKIIGNTNCWQIKILFSNGIVILQNSHEMNCLHATNTLPYTLVKQSCRSPLSSNFICLIKNKGHGSSGCTTTLSNMHHYLEPCVLCSDNHLVLKKDCFLGIYFKPASKQPTCYSV